MPLDQFKNVFVPVLATEDERPDATSSPGSPALAYAMSILNETEAHLTCRVFGVKVTPVYSLAEGGVIGPLAATLNKKSQAAVELRVAALQSQGIGAGFSTEFASSFFSREDVLDLVAFHGRLHDLSVVDQPGGSHSTGRAMVEELLFQTGRPVVIVPKAARASRPTRVVIAWDGSGRAARAVSDAMPFLETAQHITIVSVLDDKDLSKMSLGAELVPHLARHGIAAEVVDAARDRTAAYTLLDRAELARADMLVMGAFVHSRWRQQILGGVTDAILTESSIPVFMSH